MPTIVISYRRSDSSAIAGRIFDRLTTHYGTDSVFMDIDNIPFGIDFRSHIRETLLHADILLAVIGANWLGADAAGATRLQEKADPIRVEIETAFERKMPIIPVLVDGAKMPQSTELPPEFGNFSFLNAAEVATGRDFHTHMDRLIGAMNSTLAPGKSTTTPYSTSSVTQAAVVDAKASARKLWRVDVPRYFALPLVLLLVAHYVILISDLNNEYLWFVATGVPFVFGFALFWLSGVAPATAFAVGLGLIGGAGMTMSESLISGDAIVPQDRLEWRDNIQFASAIGLSFMAGHVVARALRAVLNWKFEKL